MIILDGKNLRKTYGYAENKVDAIKNISIEIEEGSFVAVAGTSGSGKSTLLHVLAGLVKPNAGKVYLQGESLYDMNDDRLTRLRRRKMGFVFQFFNLITTHNVIENIVLPIHLDNRQVDEEYVDEIIDLLKLKEKKYAFIHELSGGQQQRVAIARAIVNRPKVLIADEPTGNLDPETSKEIISLLERINEKQNTTVLVVTHDSKIVQEHKKRTILIEDGCVNADTSLGGYEI